MRQSEFAQSVRGRNHEWRDSTSGECALYKSREGSGVGRATEYFEGRASRRSQQASIDALSSARSGPPSRRPTAVSLSVAVSTSEGPPGVCLRSLHFPRGRYVVGCPRWPSTRPSGVAEPGNDRKAWCASTPSGPQWAVSCATRRPWGPAQPGAHEARRTDEKLVSLAPAARESAATTLYSPGLSRAGARRERISTVHPPESGQRIPERGGSHAPDILAGPTVLVGHLPHQHRGCHPPDRPRTSRSLLTRCDWPGRTHR